MDYERLYVGLDVGSTTIKAVVVDPAKDEILWQDYQRHETKQPEKCLEFLTMIETDFPVPHDEIRVFITGSGGSGIAPRIGAKFVQEVNAVSLAVEKLYPKCGSVIELGGQDAQIIIFKEDPETGKKKKIPSMNDKCAGGTGAVIDKINAKLHIPPEQLCDMGYTGIKLHPVAGKCGVFAETDVNSLQKMGVPNDQLMASLFDAIIGQNLSVLTRGNTLLPEVLIGIGLDGKHAYRPFRRTINGQRVAVIGATQVLDDELIAAWTAGPKQPGPATAKDVPRLPQEVRAPPKAADTLDRLFDRIDAPVPGDGRQVPGD